MAINIGVQYNGGRLPDIILLTQGYYHRGTRLNTMQWLCLYSLCNSILLLHTMSGRPGSSEVPRNPLTRWDVSSIPVNEIFLTKKLKN